MSTVSVQSHLKQFPQLYERFEKSTGLKGEWLAATMKIESGFSTTAVNKQDGKIVAVGLIQFVQSTAVGLGTTIDKLLKMSLPEQWDFVIKYYQRAPKTVNSLLEMYCFNFYPKSVGQPLDYILFKKGTLAYKWNTPFDKAGKGYVNKQDVLNWLKSKVPEVDALANPIGSKRPLLDEPDTEKKKVVSLFSSELPWLRWLQIILEEARKAKAAKTKKEVA